MSTPSQKYATLKNAIFAYAHEVEEAIDRDNRDGALARFELLAQWRALYHIMLDANIFDEYEKEVR